MRKIALLLAAALVVSAPLVAATPSLTYAAAKAKAPAAKKAAPAPSDPGTSNTAFLRAVGDLMGSLGRGAAAPAPGKAKKGKKA